MASMTELITPKQQAETYSAVERIGAYLVVEMYPGHAHPTVEGVLGGLREPSASFVFN
jgi:hypothetical protein